VQNQHRPPACGLRKAQPTAATKADRERKTTNKHDQEAKGTAVVVIRLYSGILVLSRGPLWSFRTNSARRLAELLNVWHSRSEMSIALDSAPPEITALIEALMLRRSFFQLKARLLKGVRPELQAARETGLTWLAIWAALRDAGYPGGYQQFCKAAGSLTQDRLPRSTKKSESLPPLNEEKEVLQAVVQTDYRKTQDKEKPAWQIQREETMARLDREAELNRQREAQLQPKKIFKMTPFVGRGEA
jgi:hypothetical protein